MAIGGALRGAIKAGNWAKAAMESRRRASALAQLNASGGIQGRGVGPMEWMRNQGFSKAQAGDFRTGPPMQKMPPASSRFPSSPIEAPYEGFRVLPGRVDRMGDTFSPPGPWQGRGRGTEWAELPIDGGPPYSSGSYFEPFRADNILFPERLNSFEWTRFGQYPRPTPTSRGFGLESPRYSFDDILGTSGFTDPYTGFRYNMQGFPLD